MIGDGNSVDRPRQGSCIDVSHRLSKEERHRILITCNELESVALPNGQIVTVHEEQGQSIGSESSFYRELHVHGQVHRRGRARPPQKPKLMPRCRAAGTKKLWCWDITYLPTTVRGVCLSIDMVIDVWSRKVVPWNVARMGKSSQRCQFSEPGLSEGTNQQGPEAAAVMHAAKGND